MTGIEPGSSHVGSIRFVNCAATIYITLAYQDLRTHLNLMAELLIHQLVQINKSLQIADANFWLCQMRQKMYAASVPEWELRISELNDCNDSDHFSSSNVCWCWLGIVGWAAQFVLGKFVKHHVYFSIFFVAIPGLFSVNFCSFQSLLQNWNCRLHRHSNSDCWSRKRAPDHLTTTTTAIFLLML